MKNCFMFGHATASYDVLPQIEAAAERHYIEYGVRIFTVGDRGAFDLLAAVALKRLKSKYPDVHIQLLLPYHPGERPMALQSGFDSSFYPPLEKVPRQYCIVRANQYMIENAHSIICYVNGIGNSRSLLEYAQRRKDVPIENVAVYM